MDRLNDYPMERDVVWLEDPGQLGPVKEGVFSVWGRTARPDFRHGRLVGYAKLEAGAPETAEGSGRYRRRLFWVGGLDELGVSVDPRTVSAGLPGVAVPKPEKSA